jgi:hypothetical protein
MSVDGLAGRLEAALDRGRALAEARMLSTATINRKTGRMVTDAAGIESPEWVVVATDVPIRLSGTAASSAPYKTQTPGGGTVNYAARVAHLPVTQSDLANDDYIEITGGENTGTVWRVIEATWQDQATARRVPVEQVKRPTEWGEPS